MTATESRIADKFLTEIEAAEPTVRATVINDLYSFLGVVEKRISLVAAEAKTEAPTLLAKVEGEAVTLGTEIKSLL